VDPGRDEAVDDDTKAEVINSLDLDGCLVEDLGITFQCSPAVQYLNTRLLM